MTYDRPTEPSSVIGVLTDGFLLYRASIRSLYVPLFLLLLFARAGCVLGVERFPEGVGYWLVQVAFFVATSYLYGFIIAGVHSVASNDPGSIRSSLGIAMRRMPTILVVYSLFGLALFAGSMLLVAPMVLMGLPDIFLVAILPLAVSTALVGTTLFASLLLPITEGYGPSDSFRQGYFLVRRYWCRTFVVLAMMVAIVTALSTANDQVTRFLGNQFDRGLVADIVSMLAHGAFDAIITPIAVCFMYGAYQDLRLRQQGAASAKAA